VSNILNNRLSKLERRSAPLQMPTVIVSIVEVDGSEELHHALLWDADAGRYDKIEDKAELEARYGNRH